MRFRRRKTYGESGNSNCPFCGRMAIAKNASGVDVCKDHVKEKFEDIKCKCGSWLELRNGKFGMYFNCLNCGNIKYDKGMEMKAAMKKDAGKSGIKSGQSKVKWPAKKKVEERISKYSGRQEIVISSRDSEWFD